MARYDKANGTPNNTSLAIIRFNIFGAFRCGRRALSARALSAKSYKVQTPASMHTP
jgi:hypothetical protein